MKPKLKPNDIRARRVDYIREIVNIRAVDLSDDNQDMIIEGQAIVFNQETVLFKYNGVEYKEIIDGHAVDEADTRECFLKFNHDDNMVVARVKQGSLELEIREDGLFIKAKLSNTTAGRDLYELVRSGIIDKMSFAFSIGEESFNEDTHTWTVRKIKKLYDVAAVAHPAYEQTDLYARRFEDAEAIRLQEVESSDAQKRALLEAKKTQIRNLIRNQK
jgi:hypothetical protein